MSGFYKKLMATGAALTMSLSSFAFADNVCPPPACDPCARWCDNVSFNASWLYWKVGGEDFDYAVEKFTNDNCDCLFESRTKIHDVDFDWDSGFRIGVGFDVPCWGWGVDLNWTHLDTSSRSRTHVEGRRGVDVAYSFLPVYGFTDTLCEDERADFSGAVKFRYNVIDLEFGKWCCCGCLAYRPHVGLRGADIQERFNNGIELFNTAFENDGLTINDANLHAENNFKGLGLRAGLDVSLCLCDNWSIIGRSAASVIWGQTHLRQHLTLGIEDGSEDFDAIRSNIRENFHQARYITDLSLGVRWKTVACGCYPLTVEISWEHHFLFNQKRYWFDDFAGFDEFASTGRREGEIVLQGLTVTAGFDF